MIVTRPVSGARWGDTGQACGRANRRAAESASRGRRVVLDLVCGWHQGQARRPRQCAGGGTRAQGEHQGISAHLGMVQSLAGLGEVARAFLWCE